MNCLLFSQRIYRKQFVKVAIRLKSLLALGIGVSSTSEQSFNLGLLREISIMQGKLNSTASDYNHFWYYSNLIMDFKIFDYQFLPSCHYVEISTLYELCIVPIITNYSTNSFFFFLICSPNGMGYKAANTSWSNSSKFGSFDLEWKNEP